jgi:hypothetical protein
VKRESLLAGEEWHIAAERLKHWLDPPELELDS